MNKRENHDIDEKKKIVNIPVLNIRMMSDEEWNRLAYRNWLERTRKAGAENG